nr:MAG TPA: hypothetical protein [Caudoviricetes sp.]
MIKLFMVFLLSVLEVYYDREKVPKSIKFFLILVSHYVNKRIIDSNIICLLAIFCFLLGIYSKIQILLSFFLKNYK